MRAIFQYAAVLVLGLLIGVVSSYQYFRKEMLRNLYLDTAMNTERDLAILNAPDPDETPRRLEQFLISSRIILEGCKLDLCAESEIEEVSGALSNLEKYEFRYISP